jgi:flagellar transcriptional activator FlhD
MNTEQILAEIRDTNLSYLTLAQTLVSQDRDQALSRLGITEETADLISVLSPAQMRKVASGNTVLCRMRVDDDMVWGLLTDHGKSGASAAARVQARLAAGHAAVAEA